MGDLLRLILRNASRNKVRTLLTVAGTAVAVIAFGFLQTVLAAYTIGVEAASPSRLVTRHRVSLFNLLPYAYGEKIASLPGVTQVSWGNWFGGYYKDPQQFFGQLAVDDRYMDLYPEFILSAEEKAAYNAELQAAVIGAKLAKRFDWKIGDRITLLGSPYTGPEGWDFIIRGIYHGRERITDETTMFFHWKLLNERLGGDFNQVGWYLIGIDKPEETGTITAAVDDLFFNSSAPTLTENEKAFNQSFVSMMGSIITIIKVAAWIVIGIILLIMTNTMGMSSRERTSEYGILKTLGYRAGHLLALITGESILVTVTGALVGCLIAYGLVSVIGVGIEEQMGQIFPVFEMTNGTVLFAVIMAIVVGIIAGVPPSLRAMRMPIADALRRIG